MRARDLSAYWDQVVRHFLAGGPSVPSSLRSWRNSYQGVGHGRVEEGALPEPFLGPLVSDRPAAVFLALNPGQAHLGFQSRTGIFADEIEANGSYSSWASTWPYLRDPWVASNGRNRHHTTRLAFLRTWMDDKAMSPSEMVSFELFPWHSTRVTAAMDPDPGIVHEYIWEPIADLDVSVVFAFGAPWFALLPKLRIEPIEILGAGGRPYGSQVASRSVLLARSDAGSLIIVEKHMGSAGPPSASEALLLRSAIQDLME